MIEKNFRWKLIIFHDSLSTLALWHVLRNWSIARNINFKSNGLITVLWEQTTDTIDIRPGVHPSIFWRHRSATDRYKSPIDSQSIINDPGDSITSRYHHPPQSVTLSSVAKVPNVIKPGPLQITARFLSSGGL